MRAFTLLEVLIALTILGISLTVIFSLFSQSSAYLQNLKEEWEAFRVLDSKVKLGSTEGVKVEKKELKEYNVRVRIYRKGEIELLTVE
ncbi:type II secretion system protein [Aquifex aeolicus]|uniref:type II secretion system protein n=1 Tax=Aquifex aeolicus TaxID=63363 RepID=UPI0002D69C12|nr:type II secretion system protein [Aquifex aeolicus]